MKKGYFILVNQTIGKIAIDTTGNSQYSDLQYSSTSSLWTKLNTSSNYRLYLDTIDNFNSYQSTINITYTYANAGIYTITLTFPSSNQIFQQTVNITDCEYNFRLNFLK